MPGTKRVVNLILSRLKDRDVDRNFNEVDKAMSELGPLVRARPTGFIDLVAGDNVIKPTVPGATGRLITYQSAVADLTDKGLVDGKWVITASAPCTVKLLFF